ncbi:hypothetical protein FHR75_004144 [Kineococcus radiotolerans]|uniref:Secreted protein n=1 Tax=Kineococcus radiotolerans TaxID=131568 RepID=A0A7W4XZ83_KINRA|nr:hypothetical protein [Kineococcus radiotolerans]MBB2903302.1 hypothetical protein [Kineococcus radiotolerans]
MSGRTRVARRVACLTLALYALCSCGSTPTNATSPDASAQPSLLLTPSQERAVAALVHPEFARRGNPLGLLSTTRDLVGTPLACDEVAEHLDIAIPTFPTLQGRGSTLACGSSEGTGIFEHPVPSAADPPAPPGDPAADPAADLHGVTIAYLPPGVDADGTPFDEARSRGLVWMTILYGGHIAEPPSHPAASATSEPPRSDFTTLRWRNGNVLGVQYMDPGDTRMAWRATAAGHVFAVSVDTSSDPVAGVALLTDGVDLPT